MEKPFYGRTGLLDSGRGGGAPATRPRLRTASPTSATAAAPTVALKWSPHLLTAPQALVTHLRTGRAVDGSLVALLRLGTVASQLCSALRLDSADRAELHRRLLRWHQRTLRAGVGATAVFSKAPALSWYVPTYRLIIVKDGAGIGGAVEISQRAVTLMGKDRTINDVPLDHPSCSAQHAALEMAFSLAAPVEEDVQAELTRELLRPQYNVGALPAAPKAVLRLLQSSEGGALDTLVAWLWGRLVERQREEWGAIASDTEREQAATEAAEDTAAYVVPGATTFWSLEVMLTDLGSTNGTLVNGTRLAAFTPTALIEGDVISFGMSSRQYVVVRAGGT